MPCNFYSLAINEIMDEIRGGVASKGMMSNMKQNRTLNSYSSVYIATGYGLDGSGLSSSPGNVRFLSSPLSSDSTVSSLLGGKAAVPLSS
jgi:hypothetical protein